MKEILAAIMLAPLVYCLATFAFAAWRSRHSRRFLSLGGLLSIARESLLQYMVWLVLPWDVWNNKNVHGLGDNDPGHLAVLIPGFTESPFIFNRLRGVFEQRGCPCVDYRYHAFRCKPRVEVDRLGRFIADIAARYPRRRLVLVGHSLGALLARHCLEMKSPGVKVSLVAWGTPHRGCWMARFALTACGRQLAPEGAFVTGLEVQPAYELLNIFTEHDNLVMPWEAGHLPGVPEQKIQSGWGHNSQLWCDDAIEKAVGWVLGESRD